MYRWRNRTRQSLVLSEKRGGRVGGVEDVSLLLLVMVVVVVVYTVGVRVAVAVPPLPRRGVDQHERVRGEAQQFRLVLLRLRPQASDAVVPELLRVRRQRVPVRDGQPLALHQPVVRDQLTSSAVALVPAVVARVELVLLRRLLRRRRRLLLLLRLTPRPVLAIVIVVLVSVRLPALRLVRAALALVRLRHLLLVARAGIVVLQLIRCLKRFPVHS